MSEIIGGSQIFANLPKLWSKAQLAWCKAAHLRRSLR